MWISSGSMLKTGTFSKITGGSHGKLDWKSRGANYQRIGILNMGIQFFSGKANFNRKPRKVYDLKYYK